MEDDIIARWCVKCPHMVVQKIWANEEMMTCKRVDWYQVSHLESRHFAVPEACPNVLEITVECGN